MEAIRGQAPLGVAVAGLGAIGSLHASNLARELPGARLSLVVDEVEAVARRVGRRLGVPWSVSFADALADESSRAIVIATPTALHAGMVEAAAHAGKDILCEKPLSAEPVSGRAALEAAEAAGVCLQVGFQRRFDPDWHEAKALIAAGELGDVRLLRIAHRNKRPPHPGRLEGRLGTIFVDMTIHDLDSARWLVGEVGGLHAFGTARSEEEVAVVLEFGSGALGFIDNTRVAGYGFDCCFEVVGERATLRGGTRVSALRSLSAAGSTAAVPADHIEYHRTAYLAEMRGFVDCARTGTPPAVGGEDALAALGLALVAEQSLRERRALSCGAPR